MNSGKIPQQQPMPLSRIQAQKPKPNPEDSAPDPAKGEPVTETPQQQSPTSNPAPSTKSDLDRDKVRQAHKMYASTAYGQVAGLATTAAVYVAGLPSGAVGTSAAAQAAAQAASAAGATEPRPAATARSVRRILPVGGGRLFTHTGICDRWSRVSALHPPVPGHVAGRSRPVFCQTRSHTRPRRWHEFRIS